MGLRELLNAINETADLSSDGTTPGGAGNRSPLSAEVGSGDADFSVSDLEAEFYSAHGMVAAQLTSAERRLSDHLNSSIPSIEIQAASLAGPTAQLTLPHGVGLLGKSRLLFAVPVREPERRPGPDNALWRPTTARRCTAALGPYLIEATIHTEPRRDPVTALRLLDKQFVPMTAATVTFPDGTTRQWAAIIVNQTQLDLLVLDR